MVDAMCILVMLVFAGMGYVRGILRGTLAVLAIVAAYFASLPLSRPLTRILMNASEMSAGAAENIARVFAGLLMLFSLLIAVRLVDKHIGRTRQGLLVPWNRNLGALAGVAFSLILVFSGLCAADAIYKASPGAEGWWARQVADSRLRGWVGKRNPADRLLVTDALSFVRAAQQDPELWEKLRGSEEVQGLAEHPTVRAVLEDDELMKAIAGAVGEKDLKRQHSIGRHEKIRALLEDRELRARLLSPALRLRVKELLDEQQKKDAEGAEAGRPGAGS